MKALRFENSELRLSDVDIPHRGGEVLVRITIAGICNTDLEIVRGYANFCGTLGHEFVGIVEDSPDESQIGRRVVGEINAGCGRCDLCLQSDPRHCLKRTVLGIHGRDGAFAEYLCLPPQNLLVVPQVVSDRQAVFAEPLAAACEILDQVTITPSHRVAVIGDGKLGQLIARVLATTGCDLILIGKHSAKLKLAAEAGIDTIELKSLDIDPDSRFDVVVEASGAPSGLDLALALVRPRGTMVLKSTFQGPVQINTSRIVVDELTLIGSRCGRFQEALKLLETGSIDIEPLIACEFRLADGVVAMAEAQRPGTLKVLLRN
ncbi:MAG: alcohol dehydrogenase catalytic domain-containing protein [Acidobacteria bacterium]|nr:alcohol dehydrogenase catalytic domain-containing protein [Acidobacteriota bacterium]MCI0662000.1 alcohol dehydrogenase catalytic domain-containing protein [Acidobacteriota bacterium]